MMKTETNPVMPQGGESENSGVVAREAGVKDRKPGDDILDHYVVYTVTEEEKCKYCDALKAVLDTYASRGILSYEVKRLTRSERLALYASRDLRGAAACVPQFSLIDSRSGREQQIGGREDAMVWLEHMYDRSVMDGLVLSDAAKSGA